MYGARIPRGVTINIPAGCTLTGDVTTATPMFTNETYTATGSVTAGSTTLTLSAVDNNLHVGDIVAIAGAGELNDGTQMAHMSQVTAIAGTAVTIADAAITTVSGATVSHGASNVVIRGAGVLDGDYDGVTNMGHAPVRWYWANNCQVAGTLTIRNASNIGVMIARGSQNCVVDGPSFDGIGNNAYPYVGSAIWMFGGVRNSAARNFTVTDCTYSVVLDDRSTTQDEYDGSCTYNTVENFTASGCAAGGPLVDGCSYNVVQNFTVDGGAIGAHVARNLGQGAEAYRRPAIDNIVRDATISNCVVGTRALGTGTTFTNITRVNCTVDADGDE